MLVTSAMLLLFLPYCCLLLTADEETPPSLPASPVSATIQLGVKEDEDDNQSVKSLTIIKSSHDDLTDGRSAHMSLANASAGITISVDSSLQGLYPLFLVAIIYNSYSTFFTFNRTVYLVA